MTIDGVSQSTGVERLLELSSVGSGVLMVISDRKGKLERERMMFLADDLVAILTEPPKGPQTVIGTSGEEKRELSVEVRRNEVLLAGKDSDAAVGLDDLMDALATIPSA